MTRCPFEDHDIDILTEGRCRYCGSEILAADARRRYLQQPVIEPDEDDGLVYSHTEACRCGQIHPW